MHDQHFEYEEAFHNQDSKRFRKERKLLSQKDRSKYKKTDLDKKKIPPPKGAHLKKGRVLSIMADGITVDANHTLYTCTLRGTLKKDKDRIKNLVAVGDFVLIESHADGTGSIHYVQPRYSVLSRAEHIHRRKEQLIAVNIDQVLITTSVVLPPLKPFLIDRYIIAALKGRMVPIVLINKIDFLKKNSEEERLFHQVVSIYKELEMTVIPLSAKTQEGIEALKTAMKGKSSVFSGQSGTGKTSLINLVTGSLLSTGSVIEKTKKGSHTTTTTRLLPLEGGGFCVDTPGIKSFGMWDLKKEEVEQYFAEIAQSAQGCKFFNCSHLIEPDCAVQKDLECGKISPLRFDSYCALMTSLDHPTKR